MPKQLRKHPATGHSQALGPSHGSLSTLLRDDFLSIAIFTIQKTLENMLSMFQCAAFPGTFDTRYNLNFVHKLWRLYRFSKYCLYNNNKNIVSSADQPSSLRGSTSDIGTRTAEHKAELGYPIS